MATVAPASPLLDSAATPLPGYWSWLGDALSPRAATTEALGNTMVLATFAVLAGIVLGSAIGMLLRIERIGSVLGYLAVPAIALAVPGFALFPVVDWVADQLLVPSFSVSFDESLGDGMRFVALWGTVIGLAIAPAVAAAVAGAKGQRRIGVAGAEALSASRTEPVANWRFGFPTTAFILTLAAAEIVSRHQGLFFEFYQALQVGDSTTALDLLFWVTVAGALLTLVIDLGSRAADTSAQRPQPVSLRQSRLLVPALGLGTAIIVVAVAGRLLSDPANIDSELPLASPTFGGPWLGTDLVGRSILANTTAAMGSAVVAALAPALLAVVLGGLSAFVSHRLAGFGGRLVAALTDLLWWPTPLIVPLAVVAAAGASGGGGSQQSSFDPLVIVVTGLALTPLAARLIGKLVLAASNHRLVRLLAAALFCVATAVSVSLAAAVAGFGGTAIRPDLGTMIADGYQNYERAPWVLIGPALAASLVLAALYGLGAALCAPDRTPAGVSGVAGWHHADDPTEVMAPVMASDPMTTVPLTEVSPTEVSPTEVPPAADPLTEVPVGADPVDYAPVDAPLNEIPPLPPTPLPAAPLVEIASAEFSNQATPVSPKTVHPAPVHPAPAHHESIRPEPIRPEPADAEPLQPQPIHAAPPIPPPSHAADPTTTSSLKPDPDPEPGPEPDQDPGPADSGQHLPLIDLTDPRAEISDSEVDSAGDSKVDGVDIGTGGDWSWNGDDEAEQGGSDMPEAFDPTRTVELRPSTVRRSDAVTPGQSTSRATLPPDWVKPALASRPAPADFDSEKPHDQ